METEEEGVETEYIPEEARLRLIDTEFFEERVPHQCWRGIGRCLRGIGANAELKVLTLDWTFEAPDGVSWKYYGSSAGVQI